jgi:hypothetical protein
MWFIFIFPIVNVAQTIPSCSIYDKVMHKVRKRQHQNPKFGHTQCEINKKLAKKYISTQRGMKIRKPSILVLN